MPGRHAHTIPAVEVTKSAVPAEPDSQSFFAEHGLDRSKLPPDVVRQIDILDRARSTGRALETGEVQELQTLLATQGEALLHFGSASAGLVRRFREAVSESGNSPQGD